MYTAANKYFVAQLANNRATLLLQLILTPWTNLTQGECYEGDMVALGLKSVAVVNS